MADSVADIERNVENNRSMLAQSLGQLTQALSPEQISGTVAREIQARGGAATHTALDMARANPAGAVLVGLGVAVLLAGPKKPEPAAAPDPRRDGVSAGQAGTDPLTPEFDRRLAAAEAAQAKGPRAPKMRAALNSGLANLPEPARRRVVQARQAAIAAQEKVDRQVEIAARKARSYHYRQPLATGAVAMGLGAIIAALLPRTRTEDDLMGSQRDSLLQQAELTLRDELAQATQTGEAALREGVEAGYERLRHH